MDPSTFDEFTKALATRTSRREMLRWVGGTLAGAALGSLLPGRALAADSPITRFCRQIPPGPNRGKCVNDAQQGAGLYYQCGPGAPNSGLTLCGAACVDLLTDVNNCGTCSNACSSGICCNGTCVSTSCPAGQTFNPTTCLCEGTCGSVGALCNNGPAEVPCCPGFVCLGDNCCALVGSSCRNNFDCCGFASLTITLIHSAIQATCANKTVR